ncbi:MAG: hypothetical protein M3P47_05990, partial [Pseudomonadota bacterium]|nr:hypothetical protein [Pseudomonadota bacterium]
AEDRPLPTAFEPLAKAEPAEVQKMVIGAIAKLNEIATALGQYADAASYPMSVKYSICDALEGLVQVAQLEASMLAVAALPVAKSDEPEVEAPAPAAVEPSAETVADIEKYRLLAKRLKNTLDSSAGIAHDTTVNKATDFDPASAAKLLDASTKVIKSLQSRIATLEGAVATPNALPVEGVAKSTSNEVTWSLDLARDEDDSVTL